MFLRQKLILLQQSLLHLYVRSVSVLHAGNLVLQVLDDTQDSFVQLFWAAGVDGERGEGQVGYYTRPTGERAFPFC